jgi:hypothetical protein
MGEAFTRVRPTFDIPKPKPKSGGIAVKVINHLGNGAMKVFRV